MSDMCRFVPDFSNVPWIYVDSYSGYKANERPLRFTLDDETYAIASIEDRWQELNAEYFKERTVDGKLDLGWIDRRTSRD